MIRSRRLPYLVILLVFTACARPEPKFTYDLFQTKTGWGYNILVNDKIFIHQVTVPALPVQGGFEHQWQAKNTAHLIITKLKARQLPTLSMFEVNQAMSRADNKNDNQKR